MSHKKMSIRRFKIQHDAYYSKVGREIVISPKKLISVGVFNSRIFQKDRKTV